MAQTATESLSVRRPRPFMAWLTVAAWLGFTAFAFWFFQVRPEHAAAGAVTRLFDGEEHAREAEAWFRTLATTSPIATVVHVTRSGCDCNRYTDRHLAQIVAKYQSRGVSFVRQPGMAPEWIASTPAALVFDRDGRLVYFGPYSDTAWCGAGSGQVERTLDAMLKGNAPRPQRAYVRGCFCGSEKL
jgi:hypothetical protein